MRKDQFTRLVKKALDGFFDWETEAEAQTIADYLWKGIQIAGQENPKAVPIPAHKHCNRCANVRAHTDKIGICQECIDVINTSWAIKGE